MATDALTLTAMTATTPLADLIGADAVLHLRKSEVHTLIDALAGDLNVSEARTCAELTRTLYSLLPRLADNTELIDDRAQLVVDRVQAIQ